MDKQTEHEDSGAGNPGSGPQTGFGGRSQDSESGVSPQEAAENANPSSVDSGPPTRDNAGT